MSLYRCIVLSSSGKRHVIKIDGFSKDNIIDNLRKSNFIIINAKILCPSSNGFNLLRKNRKIKSHSLTLFCKQMNTMLESGILIVKCIEILGTQIENKYFRSIINEMYKELITGSTFSEAVEYNKESFPLIFTAMVKAGELSGNIDIVMERLANHFSKENKIENKVKSALTYPAILTIVSTAAVIFLLVNVMPTFVDLYSSSGVPLPFMTVILLNISEWLRGFWYVLVLLVLLVFAISIKIKKISEARFILDSLKLRMPIYGVFAVKLAAARFSRTLSTLLGSGVSILEGLDTVAMIFGNEYISKMIINVRGDVKLGSSLSYSLEKIKLFPPMVHYMIRLGEESGEVEEVLDKIADFFDEEVDNAVQKLIALIEPIMIILMAAIIGFIMLAMVMPMFDMVNMV